MPDPTIFTEQDKNQLRNALNQSQTTIQLWSALRAIEPLQCTPNGSKTCKFLAASVFHFYLSDQECRPNAPLAVELLSEMLVSGF